MKKEMIAEMEMYLRVRDMIQKHSSSWDGMAAFDTAFTNFKERLADLQTLSYDQENALLGVSSNKDEKKAEAISVALEVLAAIRALASKIGSAELKKQMHITPTDLKKASKLDFIHLLDRILEKANIHLIALAAYKIDQAKIDSLLVIRNQVQVAINAPREAIVDRKTITLSIDECYDELNVILKDQLDMMILILKKQFPLFFKDYKGARVIIEPKVSKKKGKGLNPDEPNGETTI